jgi:glycosyltransferase involved in cell wall biosynthesis
MGLALQQQDVDVLIASTNADGRQKLPVQLFEPVDWHGLPAVFFPHQWSESWKYSRPLARWLDGHVREFDAVHIHAVFSHACVAAAQACRRRNVPYIVRPLGNLDPWSLHQKALRKRVLWHLCARQMVHGAAAIHYTTASEQHLAEAMLGLERGVVVPLGVDDSLFDAPYVAEGFRQQHAGLARDPYILILGRVHPKKGLELFFDIFLGVTNAAAHRKWRLVVAGDGEPAYMARLERLVRDRQAEERILFTGWLGGTDKLAALQGAALLALPSHQENFGLVVAEAMACAVPVLISTHVNLADEVLASGAGWVAPLEREQLKLALLEGVERKEERLSRGARGRDLARAHFRWPAVGSELVKVYRACLPLSS